MIEFIKSFATYLPEENEGQGLVEYALIIVLVSIAAIGTLSLLGPQISTVFKNITTSLGA